MKRQLRTGLLIGLALAAILAGQVRPAAAISNTPVYVLGVTDPLDPLIIDLQALTSSVTILPSISSLGTIGTNSILYVDGNWLQSMSSINPTVLSTIAGKVVSGLPTVVVRGNPTLLGDSISGLERMKAKGIPAISDGLRITATLADGTRAGGTLEVLAPGFDYAVATEFNWAQQTLSTPTSSAATPASARSIRTSPSSPTPAATAASSTFACPPPPPTPPSTPTWTCQMKTIVDTNDNFKPFGKIIANLTEFRLDNSGTAPSSPTTGFRWKDFFLNTTVIPGIVAYPNQCSTSGFCNYRTTSEVENIHPNDTNNLFVNHGPTGQLSASGPLQVSYTIGVTNGVTPGAAVTATQTQSYTLKNSDVTDTSQNSDVGWVHSINPRANSGTLPFIIDPGWTLRVTGTQAVNMTALATTTFVSLAGTSVVDTQPQTFTFVVFGG